MPIGLILAVGQHPAALDRLSSLIRADGHIVESASSITQAVHVFVDGDFDAIVLCESVRLQQRTRFMSAIRASGSYIAIISTRPVCEDGSLSKDGTAPKQLLHKLDLAVRQSSRGPDLKQLTKSCTAKRSCPGFCVSMAETRICCFDAEFLKMMAISS